MLIYTYKEQVCIKKDHEKFKILDILAVTTQVTTQAREILWSLPPTVQIAVTTQVTTQAREGIETFFTGSTNSLVIIVTTQAREGIETLFYGFVSFFAS